MEMRKFFIFGLVVIVAVFFVVRAGFYPVAIVEDGVVFKRTWKMAEAASRRFLAAKVYEVEKSNFDFSLPENQEILDSIKKDTLTFLIEDIVLAKAGRELLSDFENLTEQRVNEALSHQNMAEAATILYGLDASGFKKMVLLPQARRDVLGDALGVDFDAWLEDAKKKADVRLILVPYRWDGEAVK